MKGEAAGVIVVPLAAPLVWALFQVRRPVGRRSAEPLVSVLFLMQLGYDVEQHGRLVSVNTLPATAASVMHPAPASVELQMILPSAGSIDVTDVVQAATCRSLHRNLQIHSCSVLLLTDRSSGFTVQTLDRVGLITTI